MSSASLFFLLLPILMAMPGSPSPPTTELEADVERIVKGIADPRTSTDQRRRLETEQAEVVKKLYKYGIVGAARSTGSRSSVAPSERDGEAAATDVVAPPTRQLLSAVRLIQRVFFSSTRELKRQGLFCLKQIAQHRPEIPDEAITSDEGNEFCAVILALIGDANINEDVRVFALDALKELIQSCHTLVLWQFGAVLKALIALLPLTEGGAVGGQTGTAGASGSAAGSSGSAPGTAASAAAAGTKATLEGSIREITKQMLQCLFTVTQAAPSLSSAAAASTATTSSTPPSIEAQIEEVALAGFALQHRQNSKVAEFTWQYCLVKLHDSVVDLSSILHTFLGRLLDLLLHGQLPATQNAAKNALQGNLERVRVQLSGGEQPKRGVSREACLKVVIAHMRGAGEAHGNAEYQSFCLTWLDLLLYRTTQAAQLVLQPLLPQVARVVLPLCTNSAAAAQRASGGAAAGSRETAENTPLALSRKVTALFLELDPLETEPPPPPPAVTSASPTDSRTPSSSPEADGAAAGGSGSVSSAATPLHPGTASVGVSAAPTAPQNEHTQSLRDLLTDIGRCMTVSDAHRPTLLDWLVTVHRQYPAVFLSHEGWLEAVPDACSDAQDDVVDHAMRCLSEVSEKDTDRWSRAIDALVRRIGSFATGQAVPESQIKSFLARVPLMVRSLVDQARRREFADDFIYVTLAASLVRQSSKTYVAQMVHVLSLILLTSPQLQPLCGLLRSTAGGATKSAPAASPRASAAAVSTTFVQLYPCWCHSPVWAVGLCLCARAYEHAYDIVHFIGSVHLTAHMLLQLERLVGLLESAMLSGVRMDLLEPTENIFLVKSLYGVSMILPQGSKEHSQLTARLQAASAQYAMVSHPAAMERLNAHHVHRCAAAAGAVTSTGAGGDPLTADLFTAFFLPAAKGHV